MMKSIVCAVMALGLCLATMAADYLGGQDGLYGQGRIDVTNDVILTECVLTGTVYKTGSAMLVLDNPRSPNGGIAVESGALKVQTSYQNATIDAISSASGAPVELAVGAEGNLSVGHVRAGTPLQKTGVGPLYIASGAVGAPMVLRDGSVVFTNLVSCNTAFSLPAGGKTVNVTDGTVIVESANAGEVVKMGAGTVSFSGFPQDVSNVVVEAGMLRLCAEVTNDNSLVAVDVPNGSFESLSYAVSVGSYSTTAYPIGWTVENAIEGHSSGKVGIATSGSPWCNAAGQYVPDGRYIVFLQDDCRLSRNVSIPVRGRYRLSFWANARKGTSNGLVQVSVGGVRIGDVRAVQLVPRCYMFETPVLEAGDAVVLSFKGKYLKDDRSVVIDDVKMALVEAIPSDSDHVAIANDSFEWSEPMSISTNYVLNPTQAGWSFAGRCGIVEQWQSGMTSDHEYRFVGDSPPDGRRMSVLGVGGSMSQEIWVPSNGSYRVGLWMCRAIGSSSTVPLTLYVDDEPLSDGVGISPLMAEFCHHVCRVALTSGSHVLKLAAAGASGGDVLIDRISVTRTNAKGFCEFEGAYSDIVEWNNDHPSDQGWVRVTPGQEVEIGRWIYRSPSSDANCVCGPNASKFTDGRYGCGRVGVMIQRTSQVLCPDIELEHTGLYELSFMVRGRSGHLGQEIAVYWDDSLIGKVKTMSTEWRRISFPIIAPGKRCIGTLKFAGYGNPMNNASAFIDDVDLQWCSEFGLSNVPSMSEGVGFSLSDDAKLGLWFDGEIKVSYVRHGGRKVFGVNHVISSETCPEWVDGPGKLIVDAMGFAIIFR